MDDKELWEKAKWICVKESSCYAKDNSESVNPWEHQVTAQEQKAVLQKGEGLVLVRKCFTGFLRYSYCGAGRIRSLL